MRSGKKIVVFCPVQKGWGASTTATALGVCLEKETTGKILLIDFYTEMSTIEHYIWKDLGENAEGLPYEIFSDCFDKERLMLFCRPLSKNLYFFKGDCRGLLRNEKLKPVLNHLLKEAENIFDFLVIKVDPEILREMELEADIFLPVFSHQSGINISQNTGGAFKWYGDILKKKKHYFIMNRVTRMAELREDLRKWIFKGIDIYMLPDYPQMMLRGSRGRRLYSYLKEEFEREGSIYGKRAQRLIGTILAARKLKKEEKSFATH